MAHAAELNENNEVIRVIVIENQYEPNIEQWAIEWANGGNWKQTSFNNNFRKQFAGIGYFYNEQLDMFIIPKCHDEAVLNELGDWDCENENHYEITTNQTNDLSSISEVENG